MVIESLRAWAIAEPGHRLGVVDVRDGAMVVDTYRIAGWWADYTHDPPRWSALIWAGDLLAEIDSGRYVAPGDRRTADKPRCAWLIPPGGSVPRPGVRPEPHA